MLSWTLVILGLNLLACLQADEQNAPTKVDYTNVDQTLLQQHERLMNGAQAAIERISSQRMSLLRKRQTNESHSDDDEDDGKYHHHDHDHHDHDHGKWDIRHSVPGEPNIDYPIYIAVPSTMFTCTGRPIGYYADQEARCQAFHICSTPPLVVKSSFLCPNGSIFSQEHLVCEWWNRVNCSETQKAIISDSNLENKNIVDVKELNVQSFTDDLSSNANREQNNMIETDVNVNANNLNEDNGTAILTITDDSSSNFNANKSIIITSMVNDSSLYYEDKKKAMIEPSREDDASNAVDDKKQSIIPMVEEQGYIYDDLAKNNISVSLDDYSKYDKFMNKTQITNTNKDNSNFSLEKIETPGYVYEPPQTQGYVYETPQTPFTYPTTTTVKPDLYLDFDLDPRKSDGDSVYTSINSKENIQSVNDTETQTNSINEELYNLFPSTTISSTSRQGYDYSSPVTTPKPFSSHSPSGYSYSPPSIGFAYPNEKSVLKTRLEEDVRYTTARFPSSVDSSTIKSQTTAGFPSTSLTPPTSYQNTDSTFGMTEATFPKFESSTSTPLPETNSDAGVSQDRYPANDLSDFDALSVSNDGGSGLLNVGSTGSMSSSLSSATPSQFSTVNSAKTNNVESSTPPFRGFSGEPFSIKSTTDFPFNDKQLVSQVAQTYEDENGTVVTRVDFKFASENKTISEETNTFENKTFTRVITFPNSEVPIDDDLLNELNALGQSELRVEPSSLAFESSSTPSLALSSLDTQENSQLTSAKFSTASPIPASTQTTESPSKLLIPLSNFEDRGSVESNINAVPKVQDNNGSLEKYRVKTKQKTNNLAYYPNNPDFNNVLLNNNYQQLNALPAQVAITQRKPFNNFNPYNAFINQPSVVNSYQLTQTLQSQSHSPRDFINLNVRNNLPQQNYNYYPQQSYFNPYSLQAQYLLNNGLVNNLDMSKMNYFRVNDNLNNGQDFNYQSRGNNQAQSYYRPQQQNKYEQRSFQTDIVPSVSFDFDSVQGLKEFNLAVSTGLVSRKRRKT